MGRSTGARLLVAMLRRLGVDHVFTLSGNQVLAIYDAGLDAGMRFVDTRHEAAAAHMADAWARLRGTPGVCLVSAGPGHTNTLTAVANARLAESPVLWLSGGADLALTGRGAFQEMDQVGLAAPVCKAAWLARAPEEIPALVAAAWRTMLSDRLGPVHLTLPADVLAAPVEAEVTLPDPAACQPIAAAAEPAAVGAALALLAGARRPLIVVGPSAARGAAGRALRALTERTAIPGLTIDSPRGLTDPALHHAGQLVRQADVVLLCAPQDYAIAHGGARAFGAGCTLIEVAPGEDQRGRNRPAEHLLLGDTATVLDQLAVASERHAWSAAGWRDEVAAHQRAARASLAAAADDDAPIHPLRLALAARAALPPGPTVAIDGGEFSQWARWGLGDAACAMVVNGKFGMIGPAIPFAIGAALARPGAPAVAFVGDGTFGYHAMEFDTAVRHNIPFVAVVGNDAGWAAERHRQVALYGPDRLVASDLLPSRYDEVARALGGVGEFVTTAAELEPALRRALASGRPACVNVLIRSVPSPADPV